MLDLCKGCKCNAVCNHKDELLRLSSEVRQLVESDKSIGKAMKDGIITWRQTFGCKYYLRERNVKSEKIEKKG